MPRICAGSVVPSVDEPTPRTARKLREPNIADRRLTGTTIRLGFVLNLLTLYQVGYSRTLERSDMDENVWSTTVWLDKAEPLLTVKKFHCSFGHCLSFAVSVAIVFGTFTNALIAGEGQVAQVRSVSFGLLHGSNSRRVRPLQRPIVDTGCGAEPKATSHTGIFQSASNSRPTPG